MVILLMFQEKIIIFTLYLSKEMGGSVTLLMVYNLSSINEILTMIRCFQNVNLTPLSNNC